MRKSLSIIIPAYNEERHLGSCLDAIAAQSEPPDEVIVVDNNSTDRTAEIAQSYPFVKLVREKRQGRGHARNAGFDAAKSDLLGRINGNSILAPDWAERARDDWARWPRLGGVSGAAITPTIPYVRGLHSKLWTRLYYVWSETILRVHVLFGANMVISREAWDAVRAETCTDDTLVHEDQDISLLLAGHGFDVRLDNGLVCSFTNQSYHRWPKLHAYMKLRTKTKQRHRRLGTYHRPEMKLIPLWRKVVARIFGTLPLGLFIGSSLILYAIVRLVGGDPMSHAD